MSEAKGKAKEQLVTTAIKKLLPVFDPIKEIKRFIPHLIIDAKKFNKKFFTDRRAVGEFIDMDGLRNAEETIKKFMEKIRKPRRKDWGDIYILLMLDQKPEALEEAYSIIKAHPVKNPRILIALPKDPAAIGGHLLLMKAFETLLEAENGEEFKAEWKEKYKEMKKGIRDLLEWDDWNWFYMGGLIEKNQNITESAVISVFTEKLYKKTIPMRLPALGFHHRSNLKWRLQIRSSVEKILDVSSPLIISREEKDWGSEILRELGDMGLLHRISPTGWEESWEIKNEIPPDCKLYPLWDYLYKEVLGKAESGEEVSFGKVYEFLRFSSYGLSSNLFKVLFALFWRKYFYQIKLVKQHKKKALDVNKLNFKRLSDMQKFPDRWKIVKKAESQEKLQFVRAVLEVFAPDKMGDNEELLWEEAKNSILYWFKRLPRIILQKEFENPTALNFLRMIREHQDKNSREFISHYLPLALGYEDVRNLNFHKESPKIGETLALLVKEIDKKSNLIIYEIWNQLLKLFEAEGNDKEVQTRLEQWLKDIDSERFEKTYQGDSQILYKVIREKGDLKARMLKVLPKSMGMGSIGQWELDRTSELLSRLAKARFEMETMKYMEIRDNKDIDQRKAFLTKWFLKLFKHLNFKSEDTEEFLVNYLEEIAG